MNDRFSDRFGFLCDDLDKRLRSSSPHAASRRSSRSPRPRGEHGCDRDLSSAVVLSSHPMIAAWPAPPPKPDLVSTHQKLQLSGIAPQHSPQPLSDHQSESDFLDQSILNMIKAATAGSGTGTPRVRETELKRKIQSLEDTVAEYERQKYNVMGTFTEYKERVAERERKLEGEYSGKILALSEEVLGAKKDFEQRMKSFQALQDKFEREKESALEKLRKEHKQEIQLLEQRFSDTQLLNLEQKYMLEIRRLEEERKSLRNEKERLGETFEMNLRRAQSLYETELSAAKMLYAKELEALRDHEVALKAELAARQEEFNDRLNELRNSAKNNRDELVGFKNEVSSLQKKLRNKEQEVDQISEELQQTRTQMKEALVRLNSIGSEHTECRERSEQQIKALQEKCELLSSVETARNELESVIRDLNAEVKALKNKVEFLEKERSNLQSQSESQAHVHDSQVQALEAVLESVTKEKESVKENYEKVLTKEKQQAEAREHAMKKEFSIKLNELEEQYNALKEDLEHSAKLDRDELREATSREMESLKTEKRLLEAQVAALSSRLGDAEPEEFDEKLENLSRDADDLRRQLEEYRDRIEQKDSEIIELKQHLHQENQCAADQMMVIRDEIRLELLASDEFATQSKQQQELQNRIAELEMIQEKDDEDHRRNIKELEEENQRLREENVSVEGKGTSSDDKEKIAELEKQMDEMKDRFHDELAERLEAAVVEARAELLESRDSQKNIELQNQLDALQTASDSKTALLVTLQKRVDELMEEVSSMKTDLDKKNKELKQIGERTGEYLKTRGHQESSAVEKKIAQLNEEHQKVMKEMHKRNEELNEKLFELERANGESEGEEEEEEVEEIKPELSSSDCQTDPLPEPESPLTIVDLAREKELQMRIEQLERALQQKEELINEMQLQGQSSSSGDSGEDGEKERSPTSCIRGKSPSLLSKFRDRSPTKSLTGSSKNLLSPCDADRVERRGSPSRSLFGRSKKEEKRPAWKF